MLGKARVVLVVLLFLAGAGISGLLWLQHHGEGDAAALTSQLCGEDAPDSGCGAVNRSVYSEVAGFPLALNPVAVTDWIDPDALNGAATAVVQVDADTPASISGSYCDRRIAPIGRPLESVSSR